jgi:site-specific DNA recombinase
MLSTMRAIGYVRVSTDKQADRGVSLDAQMEKIRAMAVVQGAELVDILVDSGESAKNLNRPGMARLLGLVNEGKVNTIPSTNAYRLTSRLRGLAPLRRPKRLWRF